MKEFELPYDLYGLDSVQVLNVIYKRRLTCNNNKPIDQFKVTFERMNGMVREMKLSKKNHKRQI